MVGVEKVKGKAVRCHQPSAGGVSRTCLPSSWQGSSAERSLGNTGLDLGPIHLYSLLFTLVELN